MGFLTYEKSNRLNSYVFLPPCQYLCMKNLINSPVAPVCTRLSRSMLACATNPPPYWIIEIYKHSGPTDLSQQTNKQTNKQTSNNGEKRRDESEDTLAAFSVPQRQFWWVSLSVQHVSLVVNNWDDHSPPGTAWHTCVSVCGMDRQALGVHCTVYVTPPKIKIKHTHTHTHTLKHIHRHTQHTCNQPTSTP